MDKSKIKPAIIAVIVLAAMLFLAMVQPIFAGIFPSESENTEEGVTLTKSALWLDSAKTNAEVTITFNGLNQVISQAQTADVLFVLDTSASMASEGGCLNPEHYSAPALKSNAWAIYDLVRDAATIKPILEKAVADGVLPKAEDWNSWNKKDRIIDFSILLPVPQDAAYSNREQLYLYLKYPDWTGKPDNLFQDADKTYLDPNNWELVDFGLEATGTEDYVYHPHLWWHYKLEQDGSKTRLGYTYNPNPAEINSFWNRRSYDENDVPRCWDMSDHDCYTRANSAYDAILSFSESLLAAKPDSRIAIAAFNTAARNAGNTTSSIYNDLRTSNSYIEYTNDAQKIEECLEKTLAFANGHTNYEAGLRSAQDILLNDAPENTGNEKILVFITDGMPNYICIPATDTMATGIAAQGDTAAEKSANAFAPAAQVMADLQREFPDMTVCTASFGVDNAMDLENFVKPFLTKDGAHYIIDSNIDNGSPYFGTLQGLYDEQILAKKVITVTDIIDNRYFTVDEAAINAGGYLPEGCTVTVEAETVDGISTQRVTFTYEADAAQIAFEPLKIPLNFVIGAVAPTDVVPANTDFYPTSYDPNWLNSGTSCAYIHPDGTPKTIHTAMVWLRRSDTYNFVLHDDFQGIDQGLHKGTVTLEAWEPNVVTKKEIYIENTGTANIYVRIKLTESLTGGENNYDIQADPFIGCADFEAYTQDMETDNPAYIAAFVEDDTASHSIIDWTSESLIFNINTWDGSTTGRFWLMDTSTGWAYWMEALTPGQNTDKFLNSLCLTKEQTDLCYTIHVEADAISAKNVTDMYQWTKDNYMASGKDVGDVDDIKRIFDVFYAEATGLKGQ